MKKVKGFSYNTEKDKDVIEYIEKQPHQANYILNLIRKDMNKKNNELEYLVKKYVEELLKDKKMTIKTNQNDNITKENVMDLLNIGKVK